MTCYYCAAFFCRCSRCRVKQGGPNDEHTTEGWAGSLRKPPICADCEKANPEANEVTLRIVASPPATWAEHVAAKDLDDKLLALQARAIEDAGILGPPQPEEERHRSAAVLRAYYGQPEPRQGPHREGCACFTCVKKWGNAVGRNVCGEAMSKYLPEKADEDLT